MIKLVAGSRSWKYYNNPSKKSLSGFSYTNRRLITAMYEKTDTIDCYKYNNIS